ncbi:T9SS type A sorting domain-containing protein [Hymenobacter koreensis]|uniref:T9SS type A sorting domain-containing protein n=1 Tax=Hymenobacter koreensis TaxID=1084523 RepID=UPI0031E53556
MKTFTKFEQLARIGRVAALGFMLLAPGWVAAQTATANWQWANRATSTSAADDYSDGSLIKVDGAGNVFNAGSFHGTVTLGGTSLASPGDYDSFVAKYTPTGTVAWVRHLNGSSLETVVYTLEVDASGNSYVGGYYYDGTLVIGTTTLTGGGGFLVKYDPQGNVLWVRETGDICSGVASSSAGELVAFGHFEGTAVFGGTTLTSGPTGSSFLVKYDAQGTALWARQIEGSSNDEGHVDLDAAGNAYIAADFEGTATFGPIILPGNPSDEDAFVAKYDAAGIPQWALRQPIAGSPGREHAWALSTDAAGNTYLVGSTEPATGSDVYWFVTKYMPQGSVSWNYVSGAASESGLLGVTTDAAGNVYVSGGVTGSLSIGGLSVASSGSANTDLALLSFTAQGAPRWAIATGSATGVEAALGLAVDRTDNVYVTGIVQGDAALGPLALPQNSTSEEQFVAKASISAITAAKSLRATEPLQLYPNPARGTNVQLRWSGLADASAELQVHDALGRQVLTLPMPAGRTEAVLPTNSLKRGVYTLRLQTTKSVATGRLVIE